MWLTIIYIAFPNRQENTFQAVLATNGQTSFVLFVYGSIQWGQASIGFNAGDGIHFFMVPGALGPATRDMETQSNVNVSGLYIYQVDGPTVVSPDGKALSVQYSMWDIINWST